MLIILKANSLLQPYWAYVIINGSLDRESPVRALTNMHLSQYIFTAWVLHDLNFLYPTASFRFYEPLDLWQYVGVLLHSKNNIQNSSISYLLLKPLRVGTKVTKNGYTVVAASGVNLAAWLILLSFHCYNKLGSTLSNSSKEALFPMDLCLLGD